MIGSSPPYNHSLASGFRLPRSLCNSTQDLPKHKSQIFRLPTIPHPTPCRGGRHTHTHTLILYSNFRLMHMTLIRLQPEGDATAAALGLPSRSSQKGSGPPVVCHCHICCPCPVILRPKSCSFKAFYLLHRALGQPLIFIFLRYGILYLFLFLCRCFGFLLNFAPLWSCVWS